MKWPEVWDRTATGSARAASAASRSGAAESDVVARAGTGSALPVSGPLTPLPAVSESESDSEVGRLLLLHGHGWGPTRLRAATGRRALRHRDP